MSAQTEILNLTDRLNVINFEDIFSGTTRAIVFASPALSISSRMTRR